jgi:hypothetical protein
VKFCLMACCASRSLCGCTGRPGMLPEFSFSGSLPALALTNRAAQCIKRRLLICNQIVARSPFWSTPASLRKGRGNAPNLKTSSSSPSLFSTHAAVAASKCAPSFHIRPMRTASFRATATRARFGPSFLMSFRPQLRKAKRFFTVVSSTLAAS